MRKLLKVDNLRGSDRAYELEDGQRVLVRVRRRLLDRSGQVALSFCVCPISADGAPLEEEHGPCCPPRVHTVTQDSLAEGKIDLSALIDQEVDLALDRWQKHRSALAALIDLIDEEDTP
jgi:hypothetical protein